MAIKLEDYIRLTPEGLPTKAFKNKIKTAEESAAANFYNYTRAIIKDTLQGPLSYCDSGKTAALYKNNLDCFTKDPNGQLFLEQMRHNPPYTHITNLIDEGINRNPTQDVSFNLWHTHMRHYVREKILPQDYTQLPAYTEIFNNTYPDRTPAKLSSNFLTDDTLYAARLPSIADFTSRYKAKSRAINDHQLVTFDAIDTTEYIAGLARLRYKSETIEKTTCPKEKSQQIKMRITDIADIITPPNSQITILYAPPEKLDADKQKSPKEIGCMITEQLSSEFVSVKYFCVTKKRSSQYLWHAFFENNPDVTCVQAPLVESAYAKSHLMAIGFKPNADVESQATNTWQQKGPSLKDFKAKVGVALRPKTA